jgi:ketosteroid isomerase-like protein
MYQLIAKQKIRQGFQDISHANFDPLLKQFAPDSHFTFAGNHALAGEFHNREAVQEWFNRVHRLFPKLQLVADHIYVSGPPWDMVVTSRWTVSDTLSDGHMYRNHGVQIVRIKMGMVVEDHLIEDNQILVATLDHLAKLGVAEAANGPLAA